MRVLIDGNVHDPLSPAEEQDVRQFRPEESVQGSVLSADEATKARVGQAKRVLANKTVLDFDPVLAEMWRLIHARLHHHALRRAPAF